MHQKDRQSFTLKLCPDRLVILQLEKHAPWPAWLNSGSIQMLIRAAGECTIVCPAANVPDMYSKGTLWMALEVAGPFDFETTGVMAELSTTLANAKVPLMAYATYSTDLILVQERDISVAVDALITAGHQVVP